MVKRPKLGLYGERLKQMNDFRSLRHRNISNRMLLQTIEGMLVMDAIDEMAVWDSPIEPKGSSEVEFINFTINQSSYPNLYEAYENFGHGLKEEIFASYLMVAISLWLDTSNRDRVSRFLKASKSSKQNSSDYSRMPEAPRPDDELVEVTTNKAQSGTEVAKEVTDELNAVVTVLDGLEDKGVFDDFEFEMDDTPSLDVDPDRYEISDDDALDVFEST